MKVTLTTDGKKELYDLLPGTEEVSRFRDECREGLRRVGDRWKAESVRNAPRSPSKEMLRKLHKGGSFTTKATARLGPQAISLTRFYRASAAALAERKRGTYAGPADGLGARLSGANWKNPGGLEMSIQFESDGEKVEVYVASNAEAGEYAHIIHDMKGVKWHERGPGTQAKGDRADDKFIERAQPDAVEKLGGVMRKALKALFGV